MVNTEIFKMKVLVIKSPVKIGRKAINRILSGYVIDEEPHPSHEVVSKSINQVKAEWKDNYKHWTELCLVLNHKIWQWHERDNQKATLYDRRMARRAAGVLLSNNGLKQSVGRCEVSPL